MRAEKQLALRVGERLCHDAFALSCKVLTHNAAQKGYGVGGTGVTGGGAAGSGGSSYPGGGGPFNG
jgi:hypothetical protein